MIKFKGPAVWKKYLSKARVIIFNLMLIKDLTTYWFIERWVHNELSYVMENFMIFFEIVQVGFLEYGNIASIRESTN